MGDTRCVSGSGMGAPTILVTLLKDLCSYVYFRFLSYKKGLETKNSQA